MMWRGPCLGNVERCKCESSPPNVRISQSRCIRDRSSWKKVCVEQMMLIIQTQFSPIKWWMNVLKFKVSYGETKQSILYQLQRKKWIRSRLRYASWMQLKPIEDNINWAHNLEDGLVSILHCFIVHLHKADWGTPSTNTRPSWSMWFSWLNKR